MFLSLFFFFFLKYKILLEAGSILPPIYVYFAASWLYICKMLTFNQNYILILKQFVQPMLIMLPNWYHQNSSLTMNSKYLQFEAHAKLPVLLEFTFSKNALKLTFATTSIYKKYGRIDDMSLNTNVTFFCFKQKYIVKNFF